MFDLETLQKALQFAVREENYTAAAELRDQIRRAERADPLLSLAARLREAVAEERFGDAALLRDQLKELAPPPPDPPSTSSSKVTEGVRVSVQSCFVPSQSRPAASAFLYAYRIRIENVSHPCTVKLVSRHWIITDAQGGVQEVRGPGVVGEEPELAPGCSFEYQSACPLRSASGSMKGSFEFYSRAGETGAWSTSFLVEVAEFGLSAEGPTSL
jgi:ApaG protein